MNQQQDVLGLFWQFTLILLMAVGGLNAAIPDIQRFVVEQNAWLTARQFGEVYALSQATPGPNVMVMTMLGTVLAGWGGAVALTVAMFLPGTILTSIIIHLNARNPNSTFALAVRRGLAPVVIGLMISTAWVMLMTLSSHWQGMVMSFASALLVLRTRLNPLWLVGGGAIAGMLDII
jgi:chromate transporter